jgi:phosphatidylserine/phosphatidylglycerophosphate/cardiolipin synthase-like enzyme
MPDTHPWFLSMSELGNPSSVLVREQPWTEGNIVVPLVHGRPYFDRLAEALEAAGSDDHVLLVDWRGDEDERLRDAGPTLSEALCSLARRGGHVRGLLWRSHPKALGFQEEEHTELAESVNEVGGELLLDERVRRAGSHHQKLVVVHRPTDPERAIAFVGGTDLCHGRRDDAHHAGDPQAEHLDRRYGDRAPWHDAQAEVRGPAIADLAATFRERWNDRTPLEHRSSPVARLRAKTVREPTVPDPIEPFGPAPAPVGSHAVQVLRTYPAKRPAFPFAPDGERTIARFYLKALERARSSLYIEDQYFWSHEVGDAVARALFRAPNLRLIVVVPRFPDRDGVISGPPHRLGQERTLSRILDAGGDRVAIYDIETEEGQPIYVHAKVVVIDDEVALLGSDNMNRRSWTHDSELSIAVLDDERDERAPQDPGGQGLGARRFARDLRLSLSGEHLATTPDDPTLLDPVEAFTRWRDSARALDGWHEAGRVGPRPPGRVRRHRPEPVHAWQRLFAAPLYRLLIDPDGRPAALRRDHGF